MIATLSLTLALLGSAPAAATSHPAPSCCAGHLEQGRKFEMSVEPLGGGCYRLHYAGSNVGVYMGWDGILLVDTGFLRGAPEIEMKVTELWDAWWAENVGLLEQEPGAVVPAKPEYLPVRYVVCTHFHEDHTQANAYFGLMGAQVIAHESVRRRLLGDTTIGDSKVANPPMDPEGVPAVTFADSLSIHFNGGPIEIRFVPGAHTDGDCTVHVPDAGVLFAGDVYYHSQRFPYIELTVGARPSHLVWGLERILADLPEGTRVVPGHGPAGNDATLREFADMFADCDRQIRREVADGKDTMELYNKKLFGEYEDRWAVGMRGVRGFVQIMWYCYAPVSRRGLGELDRERPGVVAAVHGCCAAGAALGARRFDAAALVAPFFYDGPGGPVMREKGGE